jgi:hypothetical protein
MFGAVKRFWNRLREPEPAMRLGLGGKVKLTCTNPDGSIAWEDTADMALHKDGNGVTTAGQNYLLSVGFRDQTKLTPWYLGLVNNASFSAFAAADTASSHAGWIESTDYSEGVRQTWTPTTESGGSQAGTGSQSFSINGTVTIKGIFLISNSTKGGTTGTLYGTAALNGGNQALTNGQTLTISHTNTTS